MRDGSGGLGQDDAGDSELMPLGSNVSSNSDREDSKQDRTHDVMFEESKHNRAEQPMWRSHRLPENPTVCDYLAYWPMSLYSYFKRLSAAFGSRFVFLCVAVYGVNQGIGEEWSTFATSFYFADTLKVSPIRAASLGGLALIPWQMKAIYGMLSDMVPISGWHKTPYILIPGIAGCFAWSFLGVSASLNAVSATLLLLLANYSMASPDVVIDASVAERARTHPQLAVDLQSLCWGSLGVGGFVAAASVGHLVESIGPRGVYSLTLITAVAVALPAALGWLPERRDPPHLRGNTCRNIRRGFSHPVAKWVFYAALAVSSSSIFLGFFQVFARGPNAATLKGALTAVCALCIVAPSLWFFLRRVSPVLAKASAYIFLRGAIQPSTSVLFYWYHATEDNCKRGYPCLSPSFLGWMDVAGYAFLTVGTVLYNRYFSTWTYRSIFTLSHVLLVFVNFLDLLWVTRANLALGIPDEAFLFGDEVIGPIVNRLGAMPMLVLAAKVCPEGAEATVFALNMGLSNFGSVVGSYFGIVVLHALGGVDPPEFHNLELLVIIRSLTRFLPVFLVWKLVPHGSPSDDALDISTRDRAAPGFEGGVGGAPLEGASLEMIGSYAEGGAIPIADGSVVGDAFGSSDDEIRNE